MIPQTTAALLGFLFLVAPGIVFAAVHERRRPRVDRSAFREASQVALASLVFTLLAVLVLAAVRAIVPAAMPDPGRWLRQGGQYVQTNHQVVAVFFVAELALAAALAALAAWSLSRGRPSSIRQHSTWYVAFRVQRPARSYVFVRVLLSNGVEYFGKVVGYTTDYQLADRELQLGAPLYRRLPDAPKPAKMRPPWGHLSIPGSAICGIWVSYLEEPADPRQAWGTDSKTAVPVSRTATSAAS